MASAGFCSVGPFAVTKEVPDAEIQARQKPM